VGLECCGRLKKKAKPTLPNKVSLDFPDIPLPRVNCKRLNAAPKGLGGGIAAARIWLRKCRYRSATDSASVRGGWQLKGKNPELFRPGFLSSLP
jgi:hypothetical protein